MTLAPNPFADEPQPAVPRLQSAADPLNPYAAPAGVHEYQPSRDPGIGIWRDGNLLVVHLDAPFPPRCLLTNEPTDQRFRQTLLWYYPIDWCNRRAKFEYGVSPARWQRIRRVRRTAGIVSLISFLSLFTSGFWPGEGNLVDGDYGPLVFMSLIVLGIAALQVGLRWGNLLSFRRARKSYLWLHGAGAPFLESLPPWPGWEGK